MKGKFSRRDFVTIGSKMAGTAYLSQFLVSCKPLSDLSLSSGIIVNDIHSGLNPTRVNAIIKPNNVGELLNIIYNCQSKNKKISVVGKAHAMGGQQFGTDTDLIDIKGLNRIISLDNDKGIIEVESGVTWPAIVDYCKQHYPRWSIIQKQTGADDLTIGGALSANIHGRGLVMKPFIDNIESFKLVTPQGNEIECSRKNNRELFNLVIGGYGLFGIISSAKIRLMKRKKLKRIVKILDSQDLIQAFDEKIKQGYIYGDYQYMTDSKSADFMRKGVFSCYLPVLDDATIDEDQQKELSSDDWKQLYYLAFADKEGAFKAYSNYYLSTNDQTYWSDTNQLSTYFPNYPEEINKKLGFKDKASLMISEIYVPRKYFNKFIEDVRRVALRDDIDIFYGTIRLIEKDNESFMAWAKESYICIIFNLRVFHSDLGMEKAQKDFRSLIDLAINYGGSYYLTYHRWARKDQVTKCYPQFPEFLAAKKKYDPKEMIQSDWYRHYQAMFKGQV